MEKKFFNPVTGEITVRYVEDIPVSIDYLKSQMLLSLYTLYQEILNRGFISSANGTPIEYGYDSNYQLIYSKWANVLALNSTKDSITFGTPNSMVTMTRAQFLQFMDECEQFELGLFLKRKDLESKINNAQSIDDLNAIDMSLQ